MQNIYPVLIYEDGSRAIDFLEKAFGFEHAELRLEPELVMLSSSSEGREQFNQAQGSCSLYLVVDDPDAHHDHAKEAGAEIVLGLKDADYGSRGYTARDPEGNLWSFGTYQPA